MHRILLFLSTISMFLLGSACVTTQTTSSDTKLSQITEQSITLTTEDEKEIRATFYQPAPLTPGAPGVILIPDTRCDRSVFGDFPIKLSKAGFAVLSMDLRFKNLIAQARSKEEAIDLIKGQDLYAPMKYEIKNAVDFLTNQKGVDADRIALIGASFGAREALISAVRYKTIKALALVSLSGEEAIPGGKTVKTLLAEYENRPILFVTSEGDWGGDYKAAAHNRQYIGWAKGKKELKIYPGSGHGISIIKDKASDFIISWLKNNL